MWIAIFLLWPSAIVLLNEVQTLDKIDVEDLEMFVTEKDV